MYFVRSLLAWLWFMICCIAVLFAIPFRWRDASLGAVLASMSSWGSLKLAGFSVSIEHQERLYLHQPCVYVCNHQSNFDVFIIGSVYPYRTIVVAKKSITYIPIFGFLYLGMGNLGIKRTDRANALAGFEAARREIRARKLSVMVFPEGHRDYGAKTMLPFKRGAFHLAVAAQVPIVPIVASTYMDPRTKRPFLGARRHVHIRVLEPVSVEGFTAARSDIARLMTAVRSSMEATRSATQD